MKFKVKMWDEKSIVLIYLIIIILALVAIIGIAIKGIFDLETKGATGENNLSNGEAMRKICTLYTR